jgi:hypothetical protein
MDDGAGAPAFDATPLFKVVSGGTLACGCAAVAFIGIAVIADLRQLQATIAAP